MTLYILDCGFHAWAPLQLLRTLRSKVSCKGTQWHRSPGWSGTQPSSFKLASIYWSLHREKILKRWPTSSHSDSLPARSSDITLAWSRWHWLVELQCLYHIYTPYATQTLRYNILLFSSPVHSSSCPKFILEAPFPVRMMTLRVSTKHSSPSPIPFMRWKWIQSKGQVSENSRQADLVFIHHIPNHSLGGILRLQSLTQPCFTVFFSEKKHRGTQVRAPLQDVYSSVCRCVLHTNVMCRLALAENTWWRWAFGAVVKTSLGMSASHVRVPTFESHLCLWL